MKAARKAHGESTEVGTEEDLWGPRDKQVHEHKDSSAGVPPRVNMSMPTHLEIGLLPQTTIPQDTGLCDCIMVHVLLTTITIPVHVYHFA